ncbi:RDD family protein [bacterium SCSIO 12741]|nr:RDD family protein [bacterium SCSIO 12741]
MAEHILDEHLSSGNSHVTPEQFATRGQRFANYIIDLIAILVILFAVAFVLGALRIIDGKNEAAINVMVYSIMYLYYAIFEALTGKTIGKIVTQTQVVKEDGSRPDFMNILGRSLCRFIPFEHFSFFASSGRGWHDTISKTYVVDNSKRKEALEAPPAIDVNDLFPDKEKEE